MNQRFDKLVATVLTLLMLVLPGALSARERRGGKLVVVQKDGQTVKGELIAVKSDSLLLLTPAGMDESVDIAGIREIKVVKKSRVLKGALYGFLVGAVVGSVIYSVATAGLDNEDRADYDPAFMWPTLFGAAGGLVGLVPGALAGLDKTFRLEGMSESALKNVLADLRTKARIPNFR
jgi:hypothetical protein